MYKYVDRAARLLLLLQTIMCCIWIFISTTFTFFVAQFNSFLFGFCCCCHCRHRCRHRWRLWTICHCFATHFYFMHLHIFFKHIWLDTNIINAISTPCYQNFKFTKRSPLPIQNKNNNNWMCLLLSIFCTFTFL